MKSIEILMLEDSPRDAELTMRELRREGIQFNARQVMTEPEFLAGLQDPALDLILADYQLPSYDGLSALELARKERPEVPFIFVSGTLGEETAVDTLHHGATDYVVKQRLHRLGPSVRKTLLAIEESKQIKAKLRIGEERLCQALDAGQMGAWEMDIVSGASWRTPRHDMIFGYTTPPAAWNYDILLQHVVPEDLELVKHSFAQASITDRINFECRIAQAGQEPRWIAMQGRVHHNEKGERVRLMGTVRDVSERKLMEKTLGESERRFRLLADNAIDLIWTTDASERLNYVSPSIHRLLGYTPAEVLSKGMDLMFPAASATALHKKLNAIIRTTQAGKHARETFELNYIRKDGWTVCCEIICNGMLDPAGKLTGIVGVSRDISARKRAEESNIRLAIAVEQAVEAIIITDVRGTIQYANPAFERITGYTRAEAVGQNPRILKSGKLDAAFYLQMWDALNRGEVWHGHFINKKKDGTLYEEDASISPVRDAAGEIINYVAVKRDVTREVAREAQLRESQKLESIGTLAGGVAHEINNPINGIMNYAQLIAKRLAADSPLQEYAAEIVKETERVSLIVRNLLAFARQGKREHDLVSVGGIVTTSLSLINTVMRHDQITIATDIPNDLPKLKCHSQQIQQVLMNLLTNARDALNEKYPGYNKDKVICIIAGLIKKDGKSLIRMTVEDHGPGIPPEVGARIFDPFFTTKPGKGGTGLGLSISHGIVKDHGGELHYETEAGHFTRFHLDLPVT